MTVHPNDRDWDRLDALVDENPIALRDAAWRLATALTAAEHRADEAEARIKAARDVLDNPIRLVDWDDPLVPATHVRRALDGDQ